jgi:hypothetical protein
MAYCEKSDLKYGQLPIAQVVDVNKYINDAADEIDIALGTRFITPVELDTDAHNEQRTLELILKKINSDIASGRVILAVTISNEDLQTNAYGMALLKAGCATLDALASGAYNYPGLVPLPGSPEERSNTIVVRNQDSQSGVDAFYQSVAPGGLYARPMPLTLWG